MKHCSSVAFAWLILLSAGCAGQSVDVKNIQRHIKVLASDSLEGRGTGTAGEKLALTYIQTQFTKIGLSSKGDGKLFTQKFAFKSGVHGTGAEGTAYNVIGFLDNQATNTIIIGAHYDHLGLGQEGNSLEANPQNKIHNGADDNASGVAGVIELARYFKSNGVKEKNNLLFICFSGEELGLYGSKYFTEHPTIDLTRADFMINMDMIGRLDTKNGLAVSGSGTSSVWETLLKKLSTTEVPIKTDSSGMGPSDHTSFYLKNIPVLHFFTGSHSDYHKPSDDFEKINYDGEAKVLAIIIKVIEALDSEPKLAFLTTKNKSMGSSRAFKVTLGVMPSYTSDEVGLKVDGVSDGKPAQKAGLLTGDLII
ncbi:MAG: M20/M25/M40 family metallo-hydrolase, partial [Cyclobacteriaceae bacterium]|nr:M20/M25/M40 family metallo-hydrolase [Cyclobacteriaceae bacterium]